MNISKNPPFRWSLIVSIIAVLAYICTWQFYAVCWFVIAFVDLIVGVLFLIVFAYSIIFGILNRKEYQISSVPICINMMTILIVLLLPAFNRNKRYHKRIIDLSDRENCKCVTGLYLDYYCVFGGGATATDENAVYLTDLKNFRLYLGVYDEGHQSINIKCNGDQITTFKESIGGLDIRWSNPTRSERKIFSLKELRNQHVFD